MGAERNLLKQFPAPKNLLHCVISQALQVSDTRDFVTYTHSFHARNHRVALSLKWPKLIEVEGNGSKKIDAERQAAAMACKVFQDLGLLDDQNRPLTNVIYNQSSVRKWRQQQRQAKRFQVPEDVLQRVEDYFCQFPLDAITGSSYQDEIDEYMEWSDESYMSFKSLDPITGQMYSPLSEAGASRISSSLEERWDKSISLQELPVDRHCQAILSAINENQVVVIAGDTGCGKTTRIPRYILEDAIIRGHGAHCNMLITQPRRISAVSVAHRVGQELGPKLHHNVGYQVRMESSLPPRGGALLFCTVGVLLKKLQTNSGLEGVSHVVVDEVHERDVNTDFLLILLKQVLAINQDLKVILMSATGDNERISHYFENCPIVRVPGFMYPVKEHYLEDIIPMLGSRSYQKTQSPEECVADLDLVRDVILHIDKHGSPGGILCFLPGWHEIRKVQEMLEEQLCYRDGQHLILPVHSNVPLMNQQVIFERSPPDIRKIVLATNIAETSITINDIVHVVDTGMHKEHRYDIGTKVSCLETTWVSKSNVTQRRGRAGRCQPGFSYHLFTREQHQAMPNFQVAEILRTPLEHLVVQAKIHTPEMTAVEFLSQALESPDRVAIMDAVHFLQEIRVLDEKEALTLLGQRVSSFATDPSLAKVIVLAAIFRCLHPLLVIVASLSRDPFHGGLINRSEVNQVKATFSGQSCSDHLVFVRVYQAWKEVLGMRAGASRDAFISDNVLSISALRFIQGLIAQFSSNVEDASLVDKANDCTNRSALCNQLSDQDELVKGILLAGLYPKLIQVTHGCVVRGKLRPNNLFFRTTSGPVLLHRTTVNRGVNNFLMPWLTYFQAVKSNGAVFVRDSSMVHPLAVLLLTNSRPTVRGNGGQMTVALSDTDLLKLESDQRTISLLCNLRQALSEMVERNLQDKLPPLSSQEQEQYSQLLYILVELLNSTAHCFSERTEAQAEE